MTSFYKPEEGSIVGGYAVNRELGEGRFSYVVGAQKNNIACALKIYRSDRSSYKCYKNEIKILLSIPSHINIIKYHGTFAEVCISNNTPNIHPCIMFEMAGCSISDLIRHCNREYDSNIPLEHSKVIIRDMFAGIAHIHRHGVIHSDIKPSNILLNRNIPDINGLNFHAKLVDFGSSSIDDSVDPSSVGTVGYIAPEIILSNALTPAADVWSAYMSAFRIITSEHLLDIFSETDMIYGDDTYTDAIAYDEEESDYDEEDDELISYRTLVLLEKLLGPPDKQFRKQRRYYNARGKLKTNPDLKPSSIGNFIKTNFEMSTEDISALESFLLSGLKYNPLNRISAENSLKVPWLQ